MCSATTQTNWSRERKTASKDIDPPYPQGAARPARVSRRAGSGRAEYNPNRKGAPHQRRKTERTMLRKHVAQAARWLLLSMLVVGSGSALAQADQQKLVDQSSASLSNFLRDPDMSWLQANMSRAKAVIIAPELLKAGFIFGGSGGRAVVLARDPKSGRWVGPAFYTLATASVGFQAGISVSENVTLVMTDKGMNTLLAPSVKLGGDASVAAGPVGAGAKSDVVADFITFSRSKGVYGGLNLDGTVIGISNDWNEVYYNKKGVLPPDILVRRTVHNKGGDKLLAAVSRAAKK